MAVLGLSLCGGAIRLNDAPEAPVGAVLAETVPRLPYGAPIAILVHGYRFSPARAATDPHRFHFGLTPVSHRPKYQSWPAGLGFAARGLADGLCLPLAWPATAEDHGGKGLSRFSAVYHAAPAAALALAGLIETLAQIAPDRPVDLIAHSLGARVCLLALSKARIGRVGQVILMGGAEYDTVAFECLQAPVATRAQVFNITSRGNDFYDLLFRRFGPEPQPGQHPLSHGLGHRLSRALDLPFDRPEIAPLLTRRGARLGPGRRRICHWSFFTRPGALALYAEIIRNRHNWTIAELKAEAGAIPAPRRWRLPQPRPPWPPAGAVRPLA